MKKISFMLVIMVMGGLTACDSTESLNKPRTEIRTMIIGGVPVHDRDYQLNHEHHLQHGQNRLP